MAQLVLDRAVAARDALNAFIEEVQKTGSIPAPQQQPERKKLPRAPNGIHLTAEGLAELEAFFAAGKSAWDAHQTFDISYRAASLRYDAWAKKQ